MANEEVTLGLQMEAKEALSLGNELNANPTFVHKTGVVADVVRLSPTTTPAVDTVFSDTHDITGPTDTLDLTALARTGLTAVDLETKRIRAMKVVAHADNVAAVTVEPASASGYADFPTFDLGPGEAAVFYFPSDDKAAIGSGESIDISGTGGDSVDIILAAG